MDWIKLVAIVGPIATTLAGGSGLAAYNSRSVDFERAAAKYRAAKELGRACLGPEAFAAEWAEVLADLREAEGGE